MLYYMLNNILNIHNISYVFAGDSQDIISTEILQSFLNSLLASMKVPSDVEKAAFNFSTKTKVIVVGKFD